MVKIENELLKVSANELGGSLTSIYDKKRNIELLYQPIKESWAGQDVFIFPMIARLKDSSYSIEGIEYKLKNHGLLRYMTGISHSLNNEMRIDFESNEETLKQYPFKFKAYVTYKLNDNSLLVTYHIQNLDEKDMPYMIGGHPAFKLPGVKEENQFNIDGNYILFDKEVKLTRITQEETCFFNTGEEEYKATSRIDLSKDMFKKINTYIFKANDIDNVTLYKKDGSSLTLHKYDAKYLALWSGNLWGDFIAIEPWNGLPDYLDAKKDFYFKKGVEILKPQQEYIFKYSVEIK